MNPVDDAYDRVVQAMAELRDAWQSDARITADGKARLARAIREQHAAASVLVRAWNSDSEARPPALSSLEEPPGEPHTVDAGDAAVPRVEIGGPGE